jgi:hypothetical protein
MGSRFLIILLASAIVLSSYVTNKPQEVNSVQRSVTVNRNEPKNTVQTEYKQKVYEIPEAIIDTYIEKSNDLDRMSLMTDNGYKMFYGKWKATEIIANASKFPLNDNSVVGKTYYFSEYRSITFHENKYKLVDYPSYNVSIVPFTDRSDRYFSKLLPSLRSIGANGDYFTVFTMDVSTSRPWVHSTSDDGLVFPCSIVIIDDNTMVICYDENGGSAYVKLERIDYVKNYEAGYFAI